MKYKEFGVNTEVRQTYCFLFELSGFSIEFKVMDQMFSETQLKY